MKLKWLKIIALFKIMLLHACGGSDSESSTPQALQKVQPITEEEVIESGIEAEGDVDTEVEEVVEESSYGGS